jgi:short-subunit dehydrogenase
MRMIMSGVSGSRIAIVTGASSGIGKAISERLVKKGYEVYGIGRDFGCFPEDEGARGVSDDDVMDSVDERYCGEDIDTGFCGGCFHPIVCDLRDTGKLLDAVRDIMKETDRQLSLLVNNAGVAYYGLHEELNPGKISEMVRVNLEVPMILTQQLLRILKENKANIINISSVTAISSNPHGVAYGATKAGLMSFSRNLFDEVRKYGVGVTAILPDMTDTALYRNADFGPDEQPEAHLNPEDVADEVELALSAREGTCVQEIVLRPQIHRIKKKNKIR